MKISLLLAVVVFAMLSISKSEAQTDTLKMYTYETAAMSNPYDVFRLSMVKYLTEKKSLPKDILKYSNCRVLYLSAPTKRIVKGKQYFGESKFKDIPDWITSLEAVERIEIRGHVGFRFEKELIKLKDLKSLRELEMEPEEVTDELIAVLGELKQIKDLVIYSSMTVNDIRYEKLKELLPESSIQLVNQ